MTLQFGRPLAGLAAGFALAIAVSAMAQDSPSGSRAATQVVTIQTGAATGQVKVDAAGQVYTAPAAPAAFFLQTSYDITSCRQIMTVPKGKTVVVTDVQINVFTLTGTPGSGSNVPIYNSANCTGSQVGDVNPGALGLYTVSFGPGLPVTVLSAQAANGNAVETYVHGYTVSSTAAPAAVLPDTSHRMNLPRMKSRF